MNRGVIACSLSLGRRVPCGRWVQRTMPRDGACGWSRFLVVLALCGGGCVPSESGRSASDDPAAPRWLRAEDVAEWSAELELRIGSLDDPDYSLTSVRSLEVAADGTMYTLHTMEQVVRMFAADGSLKALIGGRGSGPGEFQNAAAMGWVADTLWVLDFRGYGFSQFTPNGEFIGSFSVPYGSIEGLLAIQPPRAVGLLFDGTVHGEPPAFSHQVADGTLTHHVPMLMTRDGRVTDTVPSIPFGRNQWAISDPDDSGPGGLFSRQPFGDGPLWSFVPRERALIMLDRTAPSSRDDATLRVSKLTFSGDTVFSRTYRFEPVPVRSEEVDSLLDERGLMMAEQGIFGVTAARGREWAALTLYQPAFKPGAVRMVLGRDGSIWLSPGPDGTGRDDWVVLDPAGEPIGRLKLPSGLQVFVVDPPQLWASQRDELDVPYVVRFRINRS